MNKVMYEVNEVKGIITQGKKLVLAGDESLLKQLPAGQWIAGTIPYFMTENGGAFTKDKLFVTELPSFVSGASIKIYDRNNIADVYKDAPENGFSIIIIPASSPTHVSFALNAPKYENFATRPLIGWISGVDLNQLNHIKPKVFSGEKTVSLDDGAVVMHVSLPQNKYADINIVNIFKQGTGVTITFPADGLNTVDALINGNRENFAEYLLRKNLDTRLPLVADYCGAMINTSFQAVDKDQKTVTFYAPVFKGIDYKPAEAITDYIALFKQHMPTESVDQIFFSCNCILNYLYSELEGKKTGGITGPITFGEIAYQLLNQTLVYLVIGDL